jgi:hypothetical protein
MEEIKRLHKITKNDPEADKHGLKFDGQDLLEDYLEERAELAEANGHESRPTNSRRQSKGQYARS